MPMHLNAKCKMQNAKLKELRWHYKKQKIEQSEYNFQLFVFLQIAVSNAINSFISLSMLLNWESDIYSVRCKSATNNRFHSLLLMLYSFLH